MFAANAADVTGAGASFIYPVMSKWSADYATATDGTLPTHGPLFVALLAGVLLLVGLLNYVPALALGPVVEHLMLWPR